MLKLPTIDELDTQLTPVLRKMEERGVYLDVPYLQKLAKTLAREIDELKSEIFRSAGHEFTIGSPRQLASVIYDELHLADGDVFIRRNKSGRSTAASELTKLTNAHPIIPLVLSYREKTKLLSTYVLPLPTQVDESGKLHTTYRTDTASGRLSSNNPNLQNIPTRTDEGRKIRRAFVASKGQQLLSIDYSQIELRIAAHLSDDPALIEAFRTSDDIHSTTAQQMGVDRRVAKAINFGLLFGQGTFGLAEALHISHEEAQAFIDQYFHRFARMGEWMKELQEKAHETGYAETMLGRRRYLAEINGKNANLRSFAERVAINHPVQGTEAEIISLAMIEIDKTIKEADAVMILQVHDELVFEVPKKVSKVVIKQIRDIMEGIIELKVPIITEAKLGPNWSTMSAVE